MSPLGGPIQANLSRSLLYAYDFQHTSYNIDITGTKSIGIHKVVNRE